MELVCFPFFCTVFQTASFVVIIILLYLAVYDTFEY